MIERLVKIGIGLGFLWYGVRMAAKGLIVKVKDYKFSGYDAQSGSLLLTLNLMLKNPLAIGLTIKGVVGEVYAQGFRIGGVNTTYNYYIAGGKTHILPVIVNLNLGDVLQAGWQNIQSGDIKTLTVAFNGKILIGKYNVSVPLQFELDYNDILG